MISMLFSRTIRHHANRLAFNKAALALSHTMSNGAPGFMRSLEQSNMAHTIRASSNHLKNVAGPYHAQLLVAAADRVADAALSRSVSAGARAAQNLDLRVKRVVKIGTGRNAQHRRKVATYAAGTTVAIVGLGALGARDRSAAARKAAVTRMLNQK